MLIGLIIALIFGASATGDASEFASYIPHLKKEIRQHVPEKERKDSLMVVLKHYNKCIKKYDKQKKKLRKKVDRVSADWNVSTEQMLQTYDEFYDARISALSELIEYRLLFQEQITEEEMFQITENVAIESKKERRKGKKAEAKAAKKLDRIFLNVNEIILKHIEDSGKAELVQISLQDFENTVFTYVDEARELILERKIMTSEKYASREDIEKIFARSNQLRKQASRDYAQLREVVIQNTSEKEWKAINKELKVFLKS